MPVIPQILGGDIHTTVSTCVVFQTIVLLLIWKCQYETKWIVATWPRLMLMKSVDLTGKSEGKSSPQSVDSRLEMGAIHIGQKQAGWTLARGEDWLVRLNRSCIHGLRQVIYNLSTKYLSHWSSDSFQSFDCRKLRKTTNPCFCFNQTYVHF